MEFIKYILSTIEQMWSAEIMRVASNERTWKVGCQLLNNDLVKVQELVSAVKAYENDPSSAKSHLSATSFVILALVDTPSCSSNRWCHF